MRNDYYFERMTDIALHEHDRVTPEQLRRQVKTVLMEVERTTRHKAAEVVNECAASLGEMEY